VRPDLRAERVERDGCACTLGDRLRVAAVERKESKQRPSAPFITSRLQQEAARRYGFSVKRTMGLAQGLYEGRVIGDRGQLGLITYMRTDSTRVAAEAVAGVRGDRRDLRRRQAAGNRTSTPRRRAPRTPTGDSADLFDLPPEAVAPIDADE
jgi:DNA topoisomerase IA